MVLSEKVLKEIILEKFELQAEEKDTISLRFGCTIFDKDIASFAKDEAYYLWLGSFSKQSELHYIACAIDSMPEEIEPDCYDFYEVDNFIDRNCNMYALSFDALGHILILPCWYLDVTKVQENAKFDSSLENIAGKFEYMGTKDKTFFAWGFYIKNKTLVRVFNIEDGIWIAPEMIVSRLSLSGKQILKNVELIHKKGSIQVRPVK